MRKIFIILFSLLSLSAFADKYYVTPRGNDANDGSDTTSANAWKSWHYAFNNVTPGDTVYFRGGVYTDIYSTTVGARIATTSIDGTHDNPTCFFAYPSDWADDNFPIFDCGALSGGDNYGIQVSRCSNIYFKGLHLRNVRQFTGLPSDGWTLWSEGSTTSNAPNNIRFENCVTYRISGAAFAKNVADTVYFINCDAHHNCDSLNNSDPGGHGNGFTCYGRSDTHVDSDINYTYYQY